MFRQLLKYCFNRYRLRGKQVKFKYSSDISLTAKFEGNNFIDISASLIGEIGCYSFIGANSKIDGYIGRYTSIGVNCWILRGTHLYTYPYVSTSPVFFSLSKRCGETFAKSQVLNEHRMANVEKKFSIIIGNDCWINSDVKFVSGVTIGDGAVVLAGAIVTKDVPPYAIVGGVPAKVIKYRYAVEDIEFLLKIKWWDKNHEWLNTHSNLFSDINQLKEYYKSLK